MASLGWRTLVVEAAGTEWLLVAAAVAEVVAIDEAEVAAAAADVLAIDDLACWLEVRAEETLGALMIVCYPAASPVASVGVVLLAMLDTEVGR